MLKMGKKEIDYEKLREKQKIQQQKTFERAKIRQLENRDKIDYEKIKEKQKHLQERAIERAKEKNLKQIQDRKEHPEKYYRKLKQTTPIKCKQKTARKLKGPYQSIFSSNMKVCYITGDTNYVAPHHIFYGEKDKAFSEKYHFMLPLRFDWHTSANYAIHVDRKFDLDMKMKCQDYWVNELHKTPEEWRKECSKWYTEEDFQKIS